MRFLVTGGAGYVGSHFVCEALRQGHECIVYDDLKRGHRELVPTGVQLIEANVLQQERLQQAIVQSRVDLILHFAALALVPESVQEPALYYENNVGGMLSLLNAVVATQLKIPIIFSSTCAVFGTPEKIPIAEDDPKAPQNPYGRTKLICEYMLADYARRYQIPALALRYFNACGADRDGSIGEWHEPETHLIPNILRAALAGDTVKIFGDRFRTADGTCVRDYIHVTDLARGHLLGAKRLLEAKQRAIYEEIHLGTGFGLSNLQVLEAARAVTKLKIPHVIAPARDGDPAELVCDVMRAEQLLGLKCAHSSIDNIIRTAWAWEQARRVGL